MKLKMVHTQNSAMGYKYRLTNKNAFLPPPQLSFPGQIPATILISIPERGRVVLFIYFFQEFFFLLQLFGGFLIGLSSLPVWINWMKYISIFRYAIEVSST